MKHEPDEEHYGDRKKRLGKPCGEIDFVHDVLRWLTDFDKEYIAPCINPEQTQWLRAG